MSRTDQAEKTPVLWLVALWAFATLLNLTMPYHIDDTAHLLIAEWIQSNPLNPMSGTLSWGNVPEPIFATNQPHFFFYLMAGVMAVFGPSPLALHLMLSVFTFAAIWWGYALFRRYIPGVALYATAAFVLAPGFLINQNIMVDTPLLAMITGAMYFITKEPLKGRDAGIAFLLFTLALLTKYTALFLYPAMVWAALVHRRTLVWALLPIAGLVLWSLFNIYDFGDVHILNRPPNGRGLVPSPKLTYGVVAAMGAFATPFAAALIFGHKWRLAWAALWGATVIAFVAIGMAFFGEDPIFYVFLNGLLFAGCIVLGVAAALYSLQFLVALVTSRGNVVAWYQNNRVELALLAWLLGGVGFLATFPPFMATRHVMLLMPPLIILAFAGKDILLTKRVSATVLGLWTVFAVYVFENDRQFAVFYRDMAPKMAAEAEKVAGPNAKIFTRGHWGWQWYIRGTGMIEYTGDPNQIQSGDILVDPVNTSEIPIDNMDDYELIETFWQERRFTTVLDTHTLYAEHISMMPNLIPNEGRRIDILRKK